MIVVRGEGLPKFWLFQAAHVSPFCVRGRVLQIAIDHSVVVAIRPVTERVSDDAIRRVVVVEDPRSWPCHCQRST